MCLICTEFLIGRMTRKEAISASKEIINTSEEADQHVLTLNDMLSSDYLFDDKEIKDLITDLGE